MPEDPESKTPNEVLSQKVLDALKAEGLVADGDATDILEALRKGSAKVSDWNRWAEHLLDRPTEETSQ